MKFIFAFMFFLFGYSNSCVAQKIGVNELLEKSIKYHDPNGLLMSSELTFDFIESRPNGKDRSTTVKINVKEERFRLIQSRDSFLIDSNYDKEKISFQVNGSSEILREVKERFRLDEDRLKMMRNYYQYLWLLPLKLNDTGTILHEEVFLVDFFGTESWQLKVTYDPQVGKDIWYFYFDPKSYALIGYRFYHDESANDGEYILLFDEQESNGVRLPKTRKWYTHKEDKFLGSDILDGFWVE